MSAKRTAATAPAVQPVSAPIPSVTDDLETEVALGLFVKYCDLNPSRTPTYYADKAWEAAAVFAEKCRQVKGT